MTQETFGPLTLKAEQHGLFATPMLRGKVGDAARLNRALLDAIAARRARGGGALGRSNVGGWHSTTDMLDWGGPAAVRLADVAVRAAMRLSHFESGAPEDQDWAVEMWANLLPPGALNMSHAHPGVLWAAAYYVDMGGDGAGGELFLEDPRFPAPQQLHPGFRAIDPATGKPQAAELRLTMAAGELILFPGYLRHGVAPHRGAGERVSIAMNLTVRPR